jgi:hypothetical protein
MRTKIFYNEFLHKKFLHIIENKVKMIEMVIKLVEYKINEVYDLVKLYYSLLLKLNSCHKL